MEHQKGGNAMLQIAIADDEKKPRRALRDILEPWLELQAVPVSCGNMSPGKSCVRDTGNTTLT